MSENKCCATCDKAAQLYVGDTPTVYRFCQLSGTIPHLPHEYCEDYILKNKKEEAASTDVKHGMCGEWEIFYQNGKPKLKCTNCHSLFDIRTNDKHICIYPKFCEECGTDMRGEHSE